MTEAWARLYEAAMAVIHPVDISPHMSAGGVGAAVLTAGGTVYTGVCIDTDCSLGMCAERNALSTMLTNGESRVAKVCAVSRDGAVMPPCGACREFMLHLGQDAPEIEILVDNSGRTRKLRELVPEYPYEDP